MPLISKTAYVQGLQCPKLLWYRFNQRDAVPEPDALTQAIFDQGHEVGHLAKRLFPEGHEVGADITDLSQTLKLTQQALEQRRPLFEAAFASKLAYARCDILNPVGVDRWDLLEVKSSTSAKPVYLPDIALQLRVLRDAGLKMRRCFLVCVNKDFVRHGAVDPQEFFIKEDVTDAVDELLPDVEDHLDRMADIIKLDESPEVGIGPHCDNPYTCPLHNRCWSYLPEHNVFTLARIGAKGFKLLEQGITAIRHLPEGFKLTPIQQVQRQAVLAGKPQVNKTALAAFLKRLKYPLHYLDFETFAPAIPLFDGTGPFEAVPFQFSLHIQQAPSAAPQHFMYLAEGTGDPRPEFIRRLRAMLGDQGSVVVYNATFEKGVLSRCAELLPESGPWVGSVKHRIVDLLTPFKSFHYYHPDQRGSASIKQVMPAVTGRGYDELEIQEGGTASLEFVRVTFGDVPQAERQRVRRQLEVYCGRDTEGMVWILDELRKLDARAKDKP